MIRVSIIGSGNVAQHLISAFSKTDEIEIVQVFSRRPDSVSELIPIEKISTNLESLLPADLYIVSVLDSAIPLVSEKIVSDDRFLVHTSGSLPLTVLGEGNRRGVFYPLQTFSKNKPLDFEVIPICIEAENQQDYELLEKVANAVSGNVYQISATQRASLHIAAVFVNNFANHLFKIASDICNKSDVPFDILKPLIRETAEKVMTLSPAEAQTGPAVRNDQQTIAAHIDKISDDKIRDIYTMLTNSIQHDSNKL